MVGPKIPKKWPHPETRNIVGGLWNTQIQLHLSVVTTHLTLVQGT